MSRCIWSGTLLRTLPVRRAPLTSCGDSSDEYPFPFFSPPSSPLALPPVPKKEEPAPPGSGPRRCRRRQGKLPRRLKGCQTGRRSCQERCRMQPGRRWRPKGSWQGSRRRQQGSCEGCHCCRQGRSRSAKEAGKGSCCRDRRRCQRAADKARLPSASKPSVQPSKPGLPGFSSDRVFRSWPSSPHLPRHPQRLRPRSWLLRRARAHHRPASLRTDERMMVRILTFALNADERLQFGRGISTDDEPACG